MKVLKPQNITYLRPANKLIHRSNQSKNIISMARLFFYFAFFLSTSSVLQAQTSAAPSFDHLQFTAKGVASLDLEDWSFFEDAQNHLFYIDFEKVNVNLRQIQVLNSSNEVVFSEEVIDLPVNTIYELDLHQLIAGNYTIELQSYTGAMRKHIKLQ